MLTKQLKNEFIISIGDDTLFTKQMNIFNYQMFKNKNKNMKRAFYKHLYYPNKKYGTCL